MEKAEKRQHLKRLQLIVHNRGDDELPDVVARLREACDEIYPPTPQVTPIEEIDPEAREERHGRDRKRRGGYDREG